MSLGLKTLGDIPSELWSNYTKNTSRTVKVLDIHSLLCFAVIVLVKATFFINTGVSQFANDASFLMALGSLILTGNRR